RYSIWRILLVVAIIAAAIYFALPNSPGIHLGPLQRDVRVVQGLDLQGGLRVLLEADLPEEAEVTDEQMQTARDIVENRVNALGVSEPVVQVAGSRRILVELPGVEDQETAIGTIQETGLLEFVEIDLNDPAMQALLLEGQRIQTDFGLQQADEPLPTQPPPTEINGDTAEQPESTAGTAEPAASPEEPPILHTVMTGAVLESAQAGRDPVSGEFLVSFQLTDEGAEIFGNYTTQHVGEPLAIVLDKEIISTPMIQQPITGGQGTITGEFTLEEANQLAVQLRYGSLPVPLEVVEIKSVGPTLGQDSLQKSAVAGVVGLLVVMAFMLLYYRLPGALADGALLIYAVTTFAVFKLVPVTLTLPGIAGFILSIGVAVDANVLIFERMKEELRAGKTLSQAIDLGFSRAWPSIRDSNLSTLITCAILFWFGNTFGASIVKGFSLTLAIGVLVSLFTAITVTRMMLHLVLDNIKLSQHHNWFGI
ncbi:MAG: protein translocase subunit SecD, partial [Anaerolineales bacterium]